MTIVRATIPCDYGSEKLMPGRYAVWRRFVVAGNLHAERVECNNPAYGFKVLAELEDHLRAAASQAPERDRLTV